MKHYLAELNLPYYFNPLSLHKTNNIIKLILCKDSEYRMIQNELYKYKFIKKMPDTTIHNYIEDYTLLSSENELIKCEQYYRIPYEHVIREIEFVHYKLHPQSQTIFVIEKSKNNIIDFYFDSPHEPYHHSLKEDITSFLSHLK